MGIIKVQKRGASNTIVAYGHLGDVKCYLNVSVEEAYKRYCKYIEGLNVESPLYKLYVPTFDVFTKNMKHFTFEDEFEVYDIEDPNES